MSYYRGISGEMVRAPEPNMDPPDWDEGSAVVRYAGTLITVYYSAGELGIEVDGIEHAGLTLEADDLSETMRESLVRSLQAQFDREDA